MIERKANIAATVGRPLVKIEGKGAMGRGGHRNVYYQSGLTIGATSKGLFYIMERKMKAAIACKHLHVTAGDLSHIL